MPLYTIQLRSATAASTGQKLPIGQYSSR